MPAGAFLGWTQGAAVCFPNRDEAAVLTGEQDPVTMAARLTRHYGAVVLKLGGEGCVLAVPGQAPVRVPAHPARATDTTGAGDAFCGAFLSRWLSGGPDPDPTPPSVPDLGAAAEFAARIAAGVVTRFGARPV
jgi:sugar/nucleoside kinase (ribokinase family)